MQNLHSFPQLYLHSNKIPFLPAILYIGEQVVGSFDFATTTAKDSAGALSWSKVSYLSQSVTIYLVLTFQAVQ